jgi:hypothetical protein
MPDRNPTPGLLKNVQIRAQDLYCFISIHDAEWLVQTQKIKTTLHVVSIELCTWY